MTLDQWLDHASGFTVTLPAGELIASHWDDSQGKYLEARTSVDSYVTIHLDHADIRSLAAAAMRNKSKRAKRGPLTIRKEQLGC